MIFGSERAFRDRKVEAGCPVKAVPTFNGARLRVMLAPVKKLNVEKSTLLTSFLIFSVFLRHRFADTPLNGR